MFCATKKNLQTLTLNINNCYSVKKKRTRSTATADINTSSRDSIYQLILIRPVLWLISFPKSANSVINPLNDVSSSSRKTRGQSRCLFNSCHSKAPKNFTWPQGSINKAGPFNYYLNDVAISIICLL